VQGGGRPTERRSREALLRSRLDDLVGSLRRFNGLVTPVRDQSTCRLGKFLVRLLSGRLVDPYSRRRRHVPIVGFQIASDIGVRGRSGRGAAPTEARRELPLPRVWARPVVRDVQPQVDEGRRPAKTTVGERLRVEADAFVDGHDPLWCEIRYRHESAGSWTVLPMAASYDDRWHGTISITEEGLYHLAVRARVDAFAGWRDQLVARAEAGQDLSIPLEEGARILEAAAGRAASSERPLIRGLAASLRTARRGVEAEVPADLAAWLGFDPTENPVLGRLLRSERLASLLGPLSDPATATSSKT